MDSTIGRELHPAPKTIQFELRLYYTAMRKICQDGAPLFFIPARAKRTIGFFHASEGFCGKRANIE